MGASQPRATAGGGVDDAGRAGARVTARGIAVAVAAGLLLAVGFRFGYPDLAVLGVAAAAAVTCALAYTLWQPRLSVTRVAEPDRVARGEPASMALTVRNDGRLRAADLIATDRCGRLRVPVPLLRLRPGRDTTVTYPVPTARRGVVPVGPLSVVRGDPLGLLSVARAHGEQVRVWVHPRIHALTAVPTGVARSLDGRLDRVPHGTITFDSLREYVVGDELRRVHWRTSARVGELMVREHLDTSLPRLVVLLDDRAAAHPRVHDGVADKIETACEAAASVVAAAVRDDLPVSLRLVAGGADARPYLDVLTEAALHDRADALQRSIRSLSQSRPGDTVIFLTGPGGTDDLGAVGGLRGPYASVVAAVFGAQRAPAGGDGMVLLDVADGEEFAAAWDAVRRW